MVISFIYYFINGLDVSGNASAVLSRKRTDGTVVDDGGLDTVVRYLWDFECSPVIHGWLSFLFCFTVYKTHHYAQKPVAQAWDLSRAPALHMGGSHASESAPQAVCHSGMHDGL
jgi:hypothetical protein